MASWEADKQMVGIVALAWQKSEQTSIAKIVVISRVWSSCLRSRKEEERVHEEDKRTKSNESSQLWNETEANERSNPERNKQHSKQTSHKHGMMHNQVWCMSGLKMHGMATCNKQYYKLSGAQYATRCMLTEHHINYLVISRLSYPTILTVVKHGKRWSII